MIGVMLQDFISHDVGRMPMGRRDDRAAVWLQFDLMMSFRYI
jgi:hypothetical protein